MQGIFDWINFLLAVIGAIPILISVYYFWGNLVPIRRFFNFTGTETIDVVLTTSQINHSSVGAHVLRPTTGIGQIQGAASISRFLGQYYQKKPLNIQLSASVHQRPENDLVIFGGPAKNEIAKQFINHINNDLALGLIFDDLNVYLKLGEFIINNNDLLVNDDLPQNDFALVIAWHNPFSVNPRRGFLCAGFTSYGTRGAGNWLFNDLPKQKGKLDFFKHGKAPNFITVLQLELLKGTILSVVPVKTIYFSNK